MLFSFKKRCSLCGVKIEKGEEVFKEVKVPEFIDLRKMPFCSEDHAEYYKTYIVGTPCKTCSLA